MQIGLFGVLGVVFIILKLVGVIAWSWVWVTAPLWVGLAVALAMFVVGALAAVFAAVFLSSPKKAKKRNVRTLDSRLDRW